VDVGSHASLRREPSACVRHPDDEPVANSEDIELGEELAVSYGKVREHPTIARIESSAPKWVFQERKIQRPPMQMQSKREPNLAMISALFTVAEANSLQLQYIRFL
jgi:hypothetical protein